MRFEPGRGMGVNKFTCRQCRESKYTAGRKHFVPGHIKAGWICAECAKAREAAEATACAA